jgi:demethylmenaquinone methyltransferase/2-methoxy-6-polyprenyl-1,4-benzoquinol methylase
MTLPAEKQNSSLMRAMFHQIAPRYDFFTRAFSFGMDTRWKRILMQEACLPDTPLVLDLASGTGDFSLLVRGQYPGARPVATDLTERMLVLARERSVDLAVCSDACLLPFPDGVFDCVCIGYGLRNFPDLGKALAEIARVTRKGGLFASLDFFLPASAFLRFLFLGHLYVQGTIFGLLLHRRARTYTYIPDSISTFISIDEFSRRLRAFGYSRVSQRRFLMGGIGLHWAAREE